MSQPKRYWPVMVSKDKVEMHQCASGEWTSLTEFYTLHDRLAALAAENERLKASVRHYVDQDALRKAGEAIHQQRIESGSHNREKNETIKRLAAENEVLRKKLEFLRQAEHLVIWDGERWNVRQQILPK